MARQSYPPFYAVILAVLVGSLLATLAVHAFWGSFFFVDEQLNAAVEAFGAVTSLGVAMILFGKDQHYRIEKKNLLALGFLGMGIFYVFHAVASFGHGFFLLDNLACIFGSLCFALSWFPSVDEQVRNRPLLFWVVAGCSVLVSIWITGFYELVPNFLHDDQITTTAVAMNVASGALFFAATGAFALDFHRHGRFESYLFACTFLLFGLVELEMPFYSVWHAGWWFCNFQQLLGYFIIVHFLFQIHKRAEEGLRNSHNQLEILVRERTAELSMANEQLRSLSVYLQNARESERTRIAREVHDELGQSLTALKIDLSLLIKKLPPDQKTVVEKAESMAHLVETTMQSVKKISSDLRPGVLDHLGLTAAIEWQAEEFEKRTGIRCHTVFEPEEIELDKDRTTTVFRIFQETLTNVARHARATEVSVLVEKQAGRLLLEVKDNGRGIGDDDVADPKSLGLVGMRERVLPWGGVLAIQGKQDKGTTVTVELPLDGRRDLS